MFSGSAKINLEILGKFQKVTKILIFFEALNIVIIYVGNNFIETYFAVIELGLYLKNLFRLEQLKIIGIGFFQYY